FVYLRKKTPGLAEQNGKGAPKSELRKRAPKAAAQPAEGPAEDRERRERRDSRRLEKGRSQDYPDLPDKRQEGKAAAEEKQRSEEYQTRYRSDPNLARYPVKPQPEEQQMRMHARVSRARHERRHSDVSLPHTEMRWMLTNVVVAIISQSTVVWCTLNLARATCQSYLSKGGGKYLD
ncbi:PREDICTED: regulating synaptic membrane exocytosis protein 1-like, partial [Miniopterus natalensis]|uniref:regulating synaptic membrane exocytosis protein 1-like n=1 Tax=Miniopterus natalensis TaxID=291302 RepID=UPI0007A717B4